MLLIIYLMLVYLVYKMLLNVGMSQYFKQP